MRDNIVLKHHSPNILQNLRAIWYGSLSNTFQFLNNITCIFTHFFTHTYFQKNTNNVIRTALSNGPQDILDLIAVCKA